MKQSEILFRIYIFASGIFDICTDIYFTLLNY